MKRIRSFITFSALIFTLFIVDANAQAFVKGNSERSVEQQAYKKLRGLPNYGVFDFISFEIKGDTIILSGKTHSLGTRSDAARAVKNLPGIARVVNKIEQLPASPFDDRIRASLLCSLNNGGLSRYFWYVNPDVHVIVENGRVTFEGYVSNKSDRNSMSIYANGVFGVFNVQNNVIVDRDSRRS